MKKSTACFFSAAILVVSSLFLPDFSVIAQEAPKESPAVLSDSINKIVTISCMPCHSNKGGSMSKGKLNFDEWTLYSSEKQKEKAGEIYRQVRNGGMPPKFVRENRPEIIPSREQIEIIKRWSESLSPESK